MKASHFLKITCLLLLLIPAAQAQTLGTTNLLEGNSAGSDSVVLMANAAWTATTNASWLHLSAANQSGAGSTNAVFTFDANPGATRTGTLTIAGQTLTVTQAGSTYVAANPLTTLVSFLAYPRGVAVDGAGNVYIADTYYQVIMKWTAAYNTVSSLASGLGNPTGVAVDGADNVYIVDQYYSVIKEWKVTENTVITLVSSGLDYSGVAVDGVGNVYIADQGNHAIEKWTAANSNVTTLVSSGLNVPEGVAVDNAGNVYFVDQGNYAIKEWTAASSNVTTLVSLGLTEASSVVVDGAGNVYFADYGNSSIKEWTAASKAVTTLVSSGLYAPCGVAVDRVGNVYIADYGDHAIKELPHAFVDPTTKSETPFAGSDALPVVLPATANLIGPFAPVSDSDWLTITGSTNGVVSFAFTTNPSATNRTAYITLLGQAIRVTQAALPTLTGVTTLNNGGFQFAFSFIITDAAFIVLSSTNLALPLSDWTVIGAPTNISPGLFQFTDLTATNGGQRFYRVRSP